MQNKYISNNVAFTHQNQQYNHIELFLKAMWFFSIKKQLLKINKL